MPISPILTPFDCFQIRPSFAVTPNLILEPCHTYIAMIAMYALVWMYTANDFLYQIEA